jgi:cardiolipin synthase
LRLVQRRDPLDGFDFQDHLIDDDQIGTVATGGVNLDLAYENPPSAGIPPDGNTRKAYWRDTALRLEGPAVAELQKLFFGTWREQKAPTADPGDITAAAAPRSLDHTHHRQLARRQGAPVLRLPHHCDENRRPTARLPVQRLIRSTAPGTRGTGQNARAGLDVRIIAPAFSDVQSAVYAARAAYGDLLEAGAHIYEMRDAEHEQIGICFKIPSFGVAQESGYGRWRHILPQNR